MPLLDAQALVIRWPVPTLNGYDCSRCRHRGGDQMAIERRDVVGCSMHSQSPRNFENSLCELVTQLAPANMKKGQKPLPAPAPFPWSELV